MFTIRKNTFETNSSSTHSLVMCKKSDYDRWVNHEVYFCEYGKKDFIPYNEAIRELTDVPDEQSEIDKILAEEFYYFTPETLSDFCEDVGYEEFEQTFTTDSGDTVIAFGYYGENR